MWPFTRGKKQETPPIDIIGEIENNNLTRKREAERHLIALNEGAIPSTLTRGAEIMVGSLQTLEKKLENRGSREYRETLIIEVNLWNSLKKVKNIKELKQTINNILQLIDKEDKLLSSIKKETFEEKEFRRAA